MSDSEESVDYEYLHQYLDNNDDDNETLRGEARFWAEEANQDFRRYRAALKSGEKEIANLYYDEAMLCRKYEKESNEDAAEIAFARNNEYRTFDIIDLHNLFVGEAIAKLTDRINTAKVWTDMRKLTVIVGRGLRSEYGPKLKTAVASFAVKNNIPYWYDSHNPGRMVLQIEYASEIRSQEKDNECEHSNDSDSSMYIYNRTNEVKLSEFITQTQHKIRRKKNRKKAKQRAFDRPNKLPMNVKERQNLQPDESKRNADDVTGRPDNIPPSLNTSENQRRDSTHILENERCHRENEVELEFIKQNQHKSQRSSKKKKSKQRATDRPNEVPSIVRRSQNGKQSKRKCTARNVPDNSNHMPSPLNILQIQQKDSTHILQNGQSTLLPYVSPVFAFGTLLLYILYAIITSAFTQPFLWNYLYK